jgi:hypothetical protein
MKEIYKDIKGYEDRYQVSNIGNIKSKKIILYPNITQPQVYPEKILKLEETKKGYLRVMLAKNGVHKKIYVHRLVAQHFIPNIKNKAQVNHKNGTKADNRVENLEWVTMLENIAHYNNFLKPIRL